MVYHSLLYDKCTINYDQIWFQILEVFFSQIDSALYAHSQGYHQKWAHKVALFTQMLTVVYYA